MRRYKVLARAPRGLRLLVGAAVFYPGQAALGLVVLLSVHRATGSFASAGVAGAADTIAFSISSIVQGRWIDRRGTRTLLWMTFGCALAVAGISVALTVDAPGPVLIGLAGAVGGSVPAAGASQRAVWSSVLDDPDQRATAFAFQSLAQDAGFMTGPAALGALATAVSPALALGCCASLIAAGAVTVATVSSPGTPARPEFVVPGRSIVVVLAPIAATLAAVGVGVGAIDVSTAAFATEHHDPQLAGVLLAALAAGSLVGGVAYGARSWRSPLPARLLVGTLALAALTLTPIAAPGIALAVPALLLAGIPFAPTLTTTYLLAAERAPADRQTETYALLSMALNAGAALGGALGGQLVAGRSARPGFLLAASSPLLGAAILIVPALAATARTPRSGRSR